MLGGQGGDCTWGHDDINLERNRFGRESVEPLRVPLGRSVFHHKVATLDVTEVTQSLEEGPVDRATSAHQVAYSSDLGPLLGLGRERSDDDAASQIADEHSPGDHG